MEPYNKTLITVSLAIIVAIVSIELVIAGFLGQHVVWVVELFFDGGGINVDRELELRLRIAFGLFLGFALVLWVFVFIKTFVNLGTVHQQR